MKRHRSATRAEEEPARLALYGAEPVRQALLPYGRHEIEEEDIRRVVAVLRSGWITTGPEVGAFEDAFANYVGAEHAVSFSSGTAALHGAVFAAGLGPGDRLITTPLTFCATANCVLYQGAEPVFADVRADTLTLDPDRVRTRLDERTKAVLPVDYAGHPADLDAFLEIADRAGLVVIEDACHAPGAEYRGRRVGSVSHMTAFSFHPVKHITTGEGGMVTTNDPYLARRLRSFRNHGIDIDAREQQTAGDWYYEMTELGYNYRLSDIACALGRSQLGRLDAGLARRRKIADDYRSALGDLRGLVLPVEGPDVRSAWHLYPVRVDPDAFRADRNEIFRALRAENIGVNVHYIPVHLHPYYRRRFGHERGTCRLAEEAFDRLITLPLFASMSDADAEDVVVAVRKVLGYYAR